MCIRNFLLVGIVLIMAKYCQCVLLLWKKWEKDGKKTKAQAQSVRFVLIQLMQIIQCGLLEVTAICLSWLCQTSLRVEICSNCWYEAAQRICTKKQRAKKVMEVFNDYNFNDNMYMYVHTYICMHIRMYVYVPHTLRRDDMTCIFTMRCTDVGTDLI